MPALQNWYRTSFIVAVAALVHSAAAISGYAANPSLAGFTPPGAQRGAEIEVRVNGGRLNDAVDIMFYTPGITLKEIKGTGDNTATAKLAIAPDCRLGNHAMRIRTASGLTNVQLFSVGALPEIEEKDTQKEPNNTLEKAQAISLDTTVNGSIGNEDVDYYAVDCKKGERLSAEVEGIRLGRTLFDPFVSILNKDGVELDSSDDAALLLYDGIAQIIAPEDGKYYVLVRETSYAAGSVYRLHVGRFARPRATIPSGGKLGQKVEVTLLGDVAGDCKQQFELPSQVDKEFGVFAKDDRGITPSSNAFRLGDLDNVLEVEPNDELAAATVFTAPMALNGVISKPGDVDRFKFAAKKGQQYEINVYARSLRSALDSVLTINRASGAAMGTSDDIGSPDSYLRFNAPADEEYTITVSDFLKQGGTDFHYRVEMTPVAPKLTFGLPERIQYQAVTTSIPQGNRMAFMVSTQRKDFAGEVALELKDLPPGVTFETVPFGPNQTTVPVLVTAAADAPLTGALVDLLGKCTDPKVAVEGHLDQTSELVRYQNNGPVWIHKAERMATATTEKIPFTIEVTEPKAPLVRGGFMELKVKAVREKDFNLPITVKMLYTPNGTASSTGVTIPEGKDEALIPITANPTAEINEWKCAIIAECNLPTGQVLVSSKLFKLKVADAFFQFAFKPAAVEQGNATDLLITVTPNTEFPGNAKVELLGLPAEAVAEPIEFNKDATEVSFKVQTTDKTPAGRHKALNFQAVVMVDGEKVTHAFGPAELRVDTPLPSKKVGANGKPTRSLSRLEQLRVEREATPQK